MIAKGKLYTDGKAIKLGIDMDDLNRRRESILKDGGVVTSIDLRIDANDLQLCGIPVEINANSLELASIDDIRRELTKRKLTYGLVIRPKGTVKEFRGIYSYHYDGLDPADDDTVLLGALSKLMYLIQCDNMELEDFDDETRDDRPGDDGYETGL